MAQAHKYDFVLPCICRDDSIFFLGVDMNIIMRYELLSPEEQEMINAAFSARLRVSPRAIIESFFPDALKDEIDELIVYLRV